MIGRGHSRPRGAQYPHRSRTDPGGAAGDQNSSTSSNEYGTVMAAESICLRSGRIRCGYVFDAIRHARSRFRGVANDLYESAVDMCEWAETRGCLAAVICEHHGSPDGYLPTPLILGSAIAARTKQLMLTLIVILPFYDPVRLAEEIAVLDIISKGRAGLRVRAGYRPEEYQHFGLDLKARGRIADEKLGTVASACWPVRW